MASITRDNFTSNAVLGGNMDAVFATKPVNNKGRCEGRNASYRPVNTTDLETAYVEAGHPDLEKLLVDAGVTVLPLSKIPTGRKKPAKPTDKGE